MICCNLHPDAGTIIQPKGPHIGAYCKQCGKWLKWISIEEVYECVKPELKVTSKQTIKIKDIVLDNSNDDDVPWD